MDSLARGLKNMASLSRNVGAGFYKYFAPTALVPLTIAVIIFTIAIVNWRVHGEALIAPSESSSQEQMQMPEGIDYSKFQHSNANHARLPCLLCHRRDTNESMPKRPGADKHLPCAGCHAQQFANADSPLCGICHTDAKSGAMKPFPHLRSFNMKFDHARHLGSVTCASCHRPARGGVALSIPSGFNAHTTCFRCHTERAQSGDRDISSCGTCHQLGGYSRTSQFARAFRVGFNHREHNDVTCRECHQILAGMPQRRQVTQPQALNHHATGRGKSCLTCHDGKRAFGGDDFSVCKRCHTGAAWRF